MLMCYICDLKHHTLRQGTLRKSLHSHSPPELVCQHAGEHGTEHAAHAEDGHGDRPDARDAVGRDELAVPAVVGPVHPLLNDLSADGRDETVLGKSGGWITVPLRDW